MTEKLAKFPEQLSEQYTAMRQERKKRRDHAKSSGVRRAQLSPKQRERILEKTGSRCHLCGGKISGPWQADHVLAHTGGGHHSEDNYLPAHSLCNNYRWNYTAEEFQQILKLGVWARTQIQELTSLGWVIADRFLKYERRRIGRSNKSV